MLIIYEIAYVVKVNANVQILLNLKIVQEVLKKCHLTAEHDSDIHICDAKNTFL